MGGIEERARGNCLKGGCAYVSPNGAECRRCGFDAGEFKRRRELPLEELPNGLLGKVVRREAELRGEWQLAFESPLYYFVCSVCGTKALDQIHGDAVCGNCHAKMATRWTREVINDEKETSG